MRLSVILITHNEAARLRAVLEAVAWADEIVVVDSGSTDGTPDIARAFTDRVVVTADWPGFGPQKNRALDLATGDWVLSLDADERVTPALAQEIRAALAEPRADVYALPRLSYFLGRPMRHGGWWPDEVPRLFRRGRARFSDDLVHERLVFDGRAISLREPLLHDTMPTLDDALTKMDRYARAGALRKHQQGGRANVASAFAHGLWTFLRCYVFNAGFLDGPEGFVLAVTNAQGSYYRYLRLWLLGREPRSSQRQP